jgi:hypothetical protein
MPTAVVNPTNIVFMKGYLFATIQGGNTDDVPFAELQDISFKDDISLKELMGPEQLTAVAVGITSRKVTGSAKFAKIRARQFQALRGGGTPVNASSVTTYTAGVADEPVPFILHLKTPSDGSDIEMKFFGCISQSLSLPMQMNDFVIPDFTFEAYGDGVKIYQVIVPGNQAIS